MIRVFSIYFAGRTVILALTEAIIAMAALAVATILWFGRDADLAFKYDYGVTRLLLATAVCVVCMYYHDLYDSRILASFRETWVSISKVQGTVCIVLAVLYYAYPSVQLGPGPLAIWLLLASTSLLVWRWGYLAVNTLPRMAERNLLLGYGPFSEELAHQVLQHPEYGLRVVGYVAGNAPPKTPQALPWLGGIDQLEEVVDRCRISRILLSMPDRRGKLPLEALLKLKVKGVTVWEGAELYEAITGKVPIHSIRLSWLVFSPGFRLPPWMVLYKRIASIALSIPAIIIASPLMLLIAVCVALDSPGPVVFRQKRVGKGGKIFTIYKFRSMTTDAHPSRPAEKKDPRVTRVGGFIRRMRVDELPQLFNILRGDMCFVGPRPFIPEQEEEYASKIPFYAQRWSVPPGATGWAQIQYSYCSTLEDNVEKLSYDLFYIKHLSVGLDFLILFSTLKILLLGRGSR